MDIKILSLIEQAENGCIDALWDLALIYGKGRIKNKKLVKHYLLKLSNRTDKIHPEGYAILLTALGDVCFDLKQYDEAADWYMKSIHCFLVSFHLEEAHKMIVQYKTEESLDDAFYWAERTQTMPK